MFKKIFGKKKHKEMNSSVSDMDFLGELTGIGVDVLKLEISKVFKDYSFIRNAYFTKLKMRNEDKIRIALIIDSSEPAKKVGPELADRCAGIAPIDIMFFEILPQSIVNQILKNSTVLYGKDYKLFECPIIVERGSNTDMPEDWIGAIINYYVASQDHETALLRAVEHLKGDGYIFKDVHNGKVTQLDPTIWWSGYVLELWKEYAEYFPSQEEMDLIIITGSSFKGPNLGWDSE